MSDAREPARLQQALDEVDRRLAARDGSPLDLEARGRVLRELGRDGWQADIGRAAEIRATRTGRSVGQDLQIAYLRRLAGPSFPGGDDGAALRDLLDEILPLLDRRRPHPIDGPGMVVAAFLVGRDDAAVDLGGRLGEATMGPAVSLVAETSRARRDRDDDVLGRCRERWRQLARDEPVDSTALVPAARDVVRLLDA